MTIFVLVLASIGFASICALIVVAANAGADAVSRRDAEKAKQRSAAATFCRKFVSQVPDVAAIDAALPKMPVPEADR